MLASGFRRQEIEYRVACGRLVVLHRGVYAVAIVHPAYEQRLQAALLAAGPGSAVSHRSAAFVHDLLGSEPALSISAPRSRGGLGDVTVHRPRSLQGDVVECRGLRVTTPARTLVDLCAVLSASHVAALCHEAEVLRLVTKAELRAILDRSHGRRGISKLRKIAASDLPATRSELERRFLKLIASAGLPAPRTNERLLISGRWFEFDAHWPGERIAVELDGWQFHRTRERFESDRARDVLLTAAGWTPLRFTWRRISDDGPNVIRALQSVLMRLG